MDLSALIEMHKGMLVPDMVILLDCDAEVSFQRRSGSATDVFDKDLEFQRRLQKTYRALATDERLAADNIRVVDATQSIAAVAQEIQTHLHELLLQMK